MDEPDNSSIHTSSATYQAAEAVLKEARTNEVRSKFLNLAELVTEIMLQMEREDIIAARRIAKVWNEQYTTQKAVRIAAAVKPLRYRAPYFWGNLLSSGVRYVGGSMSIIGTRFHPLVHSDFAIPYEAIFSDRTATFPFARFARTSSTLGRRKISPEEFVTYPPHQRVGLSISSMRNSIEKEMLRRGFLRKVVKKAKPDLKYLEEREILFVADGVRIKDLLASLEKLMNQMTMKAVSSCEKVSREILQRGD